jgi:ABC-2 type transport system ATP-binding protein
MAEKNAYGAGKTTLLRLATGMVAPTRGTITVLGQRPAAGPGQLARVGFVAQDTPVYARMTVTDHLRLGGWLNPGWDEDQARQRIRQLDLDPKQRAGSLSGGQRAQLALTLAMAKRPDLLILDEPVAALDPLARREFPQGLMEAVAEHKVSDLLASHRRLSGPRRDPGSLPAGQEVITESHTDKQTVLLIRTDGPVLDPAWTVTPVSLEDLVLAYMSRAGDDTPARRQRLGVVS